MFRVQPACLPLSKGLVFASTSPALAAILHVVRGSNGIIGAEDLLASTRLDSTFRSVPTLAPRVNQPSRSRFRCSMCSLEDSYVHQVYSRLATYSSSHPHNQVWPNVKKFLELLPRGSVIVDVGCGRSQHTAPRCFTVGLDTCPDIVLKVEKSAHMDAVLGNALQIPLKANSVDGALCISVLHHLSTAGRRKNALQQIARVLKPRSQVVVNVWAFEQPNGSFKAQDVLVPFNLHEIPKSGQLPLVTFHKDSTKEERVINNSIPISIPEESCPRWFRLIFGTKLWKMLPGRQSIPPAIPAYLQQLSVESVQNLIVSGIHRWSPALGRRLANTRVEEQLAQELTVKVMEEAYAEAMSTLRSVSFYRYYHLFRRGELEAMIADIPELVVIESFFESGNWCLVAQKRDTRSVNAVNSIAI